MPQSSPIAAAVLTFFIAGLLYLLRFERVDNLGAHRIPPETGLLPSGYINCTQRHFPVKPDFDCQK